MTERNERDLEHKKRRYESPRILETAEFETLALACNKYDTYPDDGNCFFNPPTSVS